MGEIRGPLKPEYLVIECTSTWTGAYSYVLTNCQAKSKVDKACRKAALRLKGEEEQTIEFSIQTLEEFLQQFDLEDYIEQDYDEDDELDDEEDEKERPTINIPDLFLLENMRKLHDLLSQLFETGYENGIIADYIECDDVSVLMAS